jgi:hypothetical protein
MRCLIASNVDKYGHGRYGRQGYMVASEAVVDALVRPSPVVALPSPSRSARFDIISRGTDSCFKEGWRVASSEQHER